MKRLINSCLGMAMVAMVVLTSCDKIFPTGPLDTAEGNEKNKQFILKEIAADAPISTLTFMSGELEKDVKGIYIAKIDFDNMKEETIYIQPNADAQTSENDVNRALAKFTSDEDKTLGKFSDLDFNYLLKLVEKAKVLVDEHNAEMEEADRVNYVCTSMMKVYFKGNPANMTYDFNLQYTPETGKTEVKGKNIITNYYEFEFSADAAGNVTMHD